LILVTGAAGFAGGHLVDLLSREGADLVAWHRPDSVAPASAKSIRWRAVDVTDGDAVASAIRDEPPSAVYHCAGAAHVGRAWNDTEPTFAINVRGTHFLLEALRRNGAKVPVLIPSSAMVYKPSDRPLAEDDDLLPGSPYGLSKLAQELLAVRAAADEIDVRIARAFNHIGPRQNPSFVVSDFARQIVDIECGRRAAEIVVGNLDARRELTDVRDTVRAYQLVLERGATARPYNVCSGVVLSIRQLLDLLIARARVPVRIRVDQSRFRPNDTPLVAGNPQRIQRELGWQPTIPLERTLDDVLEYWRGATPRF
jgi:GDP-4-dehydro-6-deoxy-D-mannose reductase